MFKKPLTETELQMLTQRYDAGWSRNILVCIQEVDVADVVMYCRNVLRLKKAFEPVTDGVGSERTTRHGFILSPGNPAMDIPPVIMQITEYAPNFPRATAESILAAIRSICNHLNALDKKQKGDDYEEEEGQEESFGDLQTRLDRKHPSDIVQEIIQRKTSPKELTAPVNEK